MVWERNGESDSLGFVSPKAQNRRTKKLLVDFTGVKSKNSAGLFSSSSMVRDRTTRLEVGGGVTTAFLFPCSGTS